MFLENILKGANNRVVITVLQLSYYFILPFTTEEHHKCDYA